MKWTTANVKNPDYTQCHEIYVGTYTGSFKKLSPRHHENPFHQKNLYDLNKLDKTSRITALEFGNDAQSEILIGRLNPVVEVYSLQESITYTEVRFMLSPVVGVARYDEHIIGGFGTGQVQKLSMQEPSAAGSLTLITGDDMAHMRYCSQDRKFVATGGKGRQNNLKIFDLEMGKQVFTSKNLPNDFLQLEVPIWDSDVGFIDSHTPVTCSRYGYVRVYDIRKQRRPVQMYASNDQMSFATLVARDNYIYAGTTMGVLKAFDIRSMKNFVHTYKGFTGGISGLHLDSSGKYLASASLDRYVRVHDANTCILLYQCYVKSKASRVLIRESSGSDEEIGKNNESGEDNHEEDDRKGRNKSSETLPVDKEYDDIFRKMETICDDHDNGSESRSSSKKRKKTINGIQGKTKAKRKN